MRKTWSVCAYPSDYHHPPTKEAADSAVRLIVAVETSYSGATDLPTVTAGT